MAVVLLAVNIWIKRITKPRPSETKALINMELLDGVLRVCGRLKKTNA